MPETRWEVVETPAGRRQKRPPASGRQATWCTSEVVKAMELAIVQGKALRLWYDNTFGDSVYTFRMAAKALLERRVGKPLRTTVYGRSVVLWAE